MYSSSSSCLRKTSFVYENRKEGFRLSVYKMSISQITIATLLGSEGCAVGFWDLISSQKSKILKFRKYHVKIWVFKSLMKLERWARFGQDWRGCVCVKVGCEWDWCGQDRNYENHGQGSTEASSVYTSWESTRGNLTACETVLMARKRMMLLTNQPPMGSRDLYWWSWEEVGSDQTDYFAVWLWDDLREKQTILGLS